jgi:hypothetical protein
MKVPSPFETDQEHAGRFEVDVATLRRWRREGMPHTKVGRIVLYRADWTRAWLETKRRGVTTAAILEEPVA